MEERVGADATANGKRKREDAPNDRKRKERKTRARQDDIQEEFSATYHGLTALYKLLEIRHLESPLFLPRTLNYRLDLKAGKGPDKKTKQDTKTTPTKKSARAAVAAVASGTLKDWKVSMTSETVEVFKRENKRIGMIISAYAANGKSFAENEFVLAATCLMPVPCAKDVRLDSTWLRPNATIYLLVFQVVDIGDLSDDLSARSQFAFEAPAKDLTLKGSELLATNALDRTPLFASQLRLDIKKHRMGDYQLDLAAKADGVKGAVKLQFRMSWDRLPKDQQALRLARALQGLSGPDSLLSGISSVLTTPKEFNAFPSPPSGKSTVWYHYLFHSMLRRMSEKRQDHTCAWCNMYAGSLRGLVAHLVSSHSRFRFQVVVEHDNVPHIYVMTLHAAWKPEFHTNIYPTMCELQLDNADDVDRIEHHFRYISSRKSGGRISADAGQLDARMHAFDELDEVSKEQPASLYAPLLQRQYFHSRTGAVVLDDEKDYDSDDDVDEEWIIQQSEKLLDEFEDVALEEKEFMKKWNRHVKENKILADFVVASSCRLFAKQHGKWLLEHGLRYNFLLHLFNLWDNSLLNARAIIDCMLIVDHYEVLQETKGK
ncbi:TPA: hypothetical protein N0F65_002877 [Lagenidium giganteum]|uniref:Polycomb protein VEFS-Box domain-containing protein n=1 Tax=Lagenidium giganteum TaxID=4803 RepID=A0AAV2ZDH5_9STRA|nr:TPA: hypothetical protein N0F65_002877 [Lagenidium giganteum]